MESREKRALVHNFSGVTRDKKYGYGRLGPIEFKIIDTPGFEQDTKNHIQNDMNEQTIKAIKEATISLFIVDNYEGLTPTDIVFSKIIRKLNKKSILVINKCEKSTINDSAFYKLGFDQPIPISAEHGTGLMHLYEAIEKETNSKTISKINPTNNEMSIVIAGRPNSGKSTFINALLGYNRVLTGDMPGMTRESINIDFIHKNKSISIIDTAGLRKKANVKETLEQLSTQSTIEAINYATNVILMIDATIAFETQDLTIANYAIKQGRNLIIAINKWDLVTDKNYYEKHYKELVTRLLAQVDGISIAFISAKNKSNLNFVLDESLRLYNLWNIKITTNKLNNCLQKALEYHKPPLSKKLARRIRIKYITQTSSRPPTFKLFSNLPKEISISYKKYLSNFFRSYFSLQGVPLRFKYTKSDNPYSK